MSASSPPAELLLSHAGFVRALARSLLRDADAAEDVAQTALVAALERPPRSSASLKSWLSSVTRNLARQFARDEGRRREHESEGARTGLAPSSAEIVEREATRALLVRTLLALPEPTRTALVLRHYEGLSPRAIAARLDVPLETVRTRLRRGLARMRCELREGEDSGAGSSWMAALVPLAQSGSKGGLGALSMGSVASVAVKLAAVAASVALGFIVWHAVDPTNAPQAQRPAQVASPAPADERIAREEPGAQPVGERRDALELEQDAASAGPVATQATPSEQQPSLVHLELRLQDPQRGELVLDSASVELFDDGAVHRMLSLSGSSSIVFEDLPAAVYRLRVHAQGVRHEEQVLDLSEPRNAQTSRPGATPTFTERAILWPRGWVQIAVLTKSGAPFHKLAEERGYEPKRLFVETFDVRAQVEAPDRGHWPQLAEPVLAEFELPPGYQNWMLPGNVVGSLRLLEEPPLWVGLSLFGTPLDWLPLAPGQDRLVFRLEQADLEARFASLRVRAVDPSGLGLIDARATLKADTSAHRRHDQRDLAPLSDGSFVFEGLLPGRYELAIQAGEALHQQRVDVAPLANVDLGQVVLDGSVGIELQVIGQFGEPVRAWIEIAPYVEGGDVDQLYPPNLHRLCERDGSFRLAMPTQRSILRATLAVPPSMSPSDDASPNVIIDPSNPPMGTLRLDLLEPTPVRFDVAGGLAERIEVLDASNLVVGKAECRSDSTPAVELVPGSYRARALDARGDTLGEQRFELGVEAIEIALP